MKTLHTALVAGMALVCTLSACGGGGGGSAQTATQVASPKPLPVYLLLGQSNMVGMRSDPALLPANLAAPQPNALFFKGGSWVPLAPGVSEPVGFGPEISFAANMPGQIGLIKVAVGGTTLAVDWNPANASGLYAQTIAAVHQAQASRSIEIEGMLWMQGESDGQTADMANAYASNMVALVNDLRRDTGNSTLPVSVCRETAPADQFPYTDVVRAAQASISMSGYQWFNCDGLTKGPDNLHYDTAGEVELGHLFAVSMTSLGAVAQ